MGTGGPRRFLSNCRHPNRPAATASTAREAPIRLSHLRMATLTIVGQKSFCTKASDYLQGKSTTPMPRMQIKSTYPTTSASGSRTAARQPRTTRRTRTRTTSAVNRCTRPALGWPHRSKNGRVGILHRAPLARGATRCTGRAPAATGAAAPARSLKHRVVGKPFLGKGSMRRARLWCGPPPAHALFLGGRTSRLARVRDLNQ
jgi:hypothetical protein